MKKLILLLFIACIPLASNAQFINWDTGYLINVGISKGMPSFSSIDRGNWGIWISVFRFELELYGDFSNYDDLDVDLEPYYSDYYKTYAGTSYTRVSKSRGYIGAVGSKYGFVFNNYFSAGIVWEMSGGHYEFSYEKTYLSTLHDGWTDIYWNDDSKDGFGAYIKLSYPFQIGKYSYLLPFVSAQVVSTKNNFISIGIMYSCQGPKKYGWGI